MHEHNKLPLFAFVVQQSFFYIPIFKTAFYVFVFFLAFCIVVLFAPQLGWSVLIRPREYLFLVFFSLDF